MTVNGLPVDLRADGLLWLINATTFHPRGFALAVDPDTGAFTLLGDGLEPWRYASPADLQSAGKDPMNAPNVDDLFAKAEQTLRSAGLVNRRGPTGRRYVPRAPGRVVPTSDIVGVTPPLRTVGDGVGSRTVTDAELDAEDAARDQGSEDPSGTSP